MTLRHFLDMQDFSRQELLDLLELIRILKEADRQAATPKLLQDATLAMIFEESSTRTQISFKVAMTELGGRALTSSQARFTWACASRSTTLRA